MTRKKETHITIPAEDHAQIQHILEQFHQIAHDLRNSTDQQQTEANLTDINNLSESSQMALLKALSKEPHTDAADILLAINELSPNKQVRKEARRSLIRLEEAKIYPQWHPPVAHTPAVQIPVAT